MWKQFVDKVKNAFNTIKSTTTELNPEFKKQILQKLEEVLRSSAQNDIQMEINGRYISKLLMEAISVQNPEEKLLKICGQKEVFPLKIIFPKEVRNLMDVLWTGCYSEVLRLMNSNGEDIILKISLIGRINKSGFVTQTVDGIVSDVINAKLLSDLKAISPQISNNYCENFSNIKCFLFVWDKKLVFNKLKTKEKSDRNSKYQYLISEQSFGGKPLNTVISLSPTKAMSIILQMIASLAVAEECLQFEHRDLHLSNLLFKTTEDKYLDYVINGYKFKLMLYGIQIVIIDTTFSRTYMKIKSIDGKEEEHYFYNDLSTLNLNDYPNSELKKVYLNQKQITGNNWKEFWPKTNIIWFEYCIKRIENMIEKWSQKHTIPSNSNYSHHLTQFKQIKLNARNLNSIKELAQFCHLISNE